MKRLERTFKILADQNRLRILNLLLARRMCVCELAYVLGVTQPSVSRHLKKMRMAGVLNSEKSGFWTDYSLKTDGEFSALLNYLKGWFNKEGTFRSDLKRLQKADRRKLCCR